MCFLLFALSIVQPDGRPFKQIVESSIIETTKYKRRTVDILMRDLKYARIFQHKQLKKRELVKSKNPHNWQRWEACCETRSVYLATCCEWQDTFSQIETITLFYHILLFFSKTFKIGMAARRNYQQAKAREKQASQGAYHLDKKRQLEHKIMKLRINKHRVLESPERTLEQQQCNEHREQLKRQLAPTEQRKISSKIDQRECQFLLCWSPRKWNNAGKTVTS